MTDSFMQVYGCTARLLSLLVEEDFIDAEYDKEFLIFMLQRLLTVMHGECDPGSGNEPPAPPANTPEEGWEPGLEPPKLVRQNAICQDDVLPMSPKL